MNTPTFHRRLFQAAGTYNFAFLAWTALAPGQFFALIGAADASPQDYLWQCVGMVVGVYGFLYLHAARHLDASGPIIAVGLLGKVLGPIGWVWTFAHGRIAAASFLMIAANDLVWWPGFASYLLRRRDERTRHRLVAVVLLVAHATGALLLAIATGVGSAHTDGEVAAVPWTLAWAAWCIADIVSLPFVRSLLRLRAPTTSRSMQRWLLALVLIAAVGDLGLNIAHAAVVRPSTALSNATLRFLSLTVTNGLFVAAYVLLSCRLAVAGAVPRWVTLLGLPAWIGAIGLCVAGCGALPGSEPICAGVFVVSFCAWLIALVLTDDA